MPINAVLENNGDAYTTENRAWIKTMVMLQRAPAVALMNGLYTHKVVLMRQHLDLVGQLARSFGNSDFAPLEPKAIVEHAAANHDSGWFEVDLTMPLDPLSHLPRNLLMAPEGNTPVVGSGSAAIGEAFHPYSGLLISMHHTGLQQDRYGEGGGKVPAFAEMVSEARLFREATGEAATWGPGVRGVDDFLAFEAERQKRLKEMLCRDPSTAPWVSQRALWTNYRALQVCAQNKTANFFLFFF